MNFTPTIFEDYLPSTYSDYNLNAEDVKYIDDLISDYLVWRGFVETKKRFAKDIETDKHKGFQASKIVENIFSSIHNFDWDGFIDLWNHLNTTFFSKLDEDLAWTVSKLEISLKRYYLIYALQNNHREKVVAFFENFGAEISNSKQWRNWFALPFTKNPATDPTFKVFYTKQWLEALTLSLHNFLATIFNSMELPRLLNFNLERKVRITMQRDLDHLRMENQRLRETIDGLKKELELQKETTTKVSYGYLASALSVTPPSSIDIPIYASPAHTILISSKLSTPSTPSSTLPSSAPTTPITPSRGRFLSDIANLGAATEKPLVMKSRDIFSESSAINCVRFSPTGGAMAAGTEAGVVRIWPLDTSNSYNANSFFGNSPVACLDWEPRAGKLVLCGSSDGKVKIYNAKQEKVVGDITISQTYKKIVNLKCGPPFQGNVFAVSSVGENMKQGGPLTFWDLNTLQSVNKMKFDPPTVINSFAFNHNGSLLVAAGQDGYIRLFDMSSYKQISKWRGHVHGVVGVGFSFDETSIFSVGPKSKVKSWSAHSTGHQFHSYNYIGIPKTSFFAEIAQDLDGSYFVVSSKENYGVLYHVNQSKPLQNVGSHSKPVVSVDWHPLQLSVATASLDNSICITHYLKNPEKQ